jgi:hypothetical protein
MPRWKDNMKFEYQCEGCGASISVNQTVGDKPSDWQPDEMIPCDNCGGEAVRIFGCDIGMDNKSDETRHIGQTTSSKSNLQFVGKGFADVDRRVENEVAEIDRLMSEPPTEYDIEAGKQQAAEIEREKGKPVGSISGNRETENVTIKAVDHAEAERNRIAASQKLVNKLEAEMVVGPDEMEKIAKDLNMKPLEVGETVTKQVQKRRGKEVLAEEAKKNRLNR